MKITVVYVKCWKFTSSQELQALIIVDSAPVWEALCHGSHEGDPLNIYFPPGSANLHCEVNMVGGIGEQ